VTSIGDSCRTRRWGALYLARVGVDDPHVLLALGALQHYLLHVDPDLLHVGASNLYVDELEELLDVPEQLLRDAFACAVDGHLQVRAAVKHSSGEHAHGDGLPEPSRCGHKDLP
jgi:hypothetical protein